MKQIRGTTKQCLAHLAKVIKGSQFFDKRKMIANFAGVGDFTVHEWFSAGRMPVGEPLIRLRFYLEFLGYEVEELQELSSEVRDAARLCAFRVASLAEIAEFVGYGGTGRSPIDALLEVFRGKRGVSRQKLGQFKSFVELYGAGLEEKERATPHVLRVTSSGVQLPEVMATRPTSHDEVGNQSAVAESFAGLITAMLPLAEYVLSDRFTAGQRSRIRELAAGGRGVSRLSNLLTQLSGEAARTALSNSRKKEAEQ